jgi:hypothetical protein
MLIVFIVDTIAFFIYGHTVLGIIGVLVLASIATLVLTGWSA